MNLAYSVQNQALKFDQLQLQQKGSHFKQASPCPQPSKETNDNSQPLNPTISQIS